MLKLKDLEVIVGLDSSCELGVVVEYLVRMRALVMEVFVGQMEERVETLKRHLKIL